MIKKSFRLMLLVAFALSSVMFVSCNKYDDDIERIDNELAALNATVTSLKAAVDGGAVISSVSNTTDGVKFTLSNGQSYTVNHGTAGKDGLDGKDGQNGKDGQDGKNGSVVTIGENGNWFIDDVDQGINATQPYVVNNGAWYSLYVMEQVDGANAEVIEVKLPTTAQVTEIKAVTINGNVTPGAKVTLNYGKKLADSKVVFKGKEYAKNSYLVAASSSLSAMVNPLDANSELFNFVLVDSKGNAPYVISNVKQHMSEKALTKADPTPNKGLWTMDIAFAAGVNHSDDKSANRSKLAYALTTTTTNGTVASAYDVTVTETKISSFGFADFATPAAKKSTETMDLTACFKGLTGALVDGNAVTDLTPYIVDYYFEIKDKTAADALGAVLDGDKLSVTKHGKVDILVNCLLVDGTVFEAKSSTKGASGKVFAPKTITAEFTYVAPQGAVGSDVTWTIQDDENDNTKEHIVYVPLGSLQNSLVGTTDNQLPTITVKANTWTWADGTALNKKLVTRNGSTYGTDATGKDDYTLAFPAVADVLPAIDGFYYVNSNGAYLPAAGAVTINTPLYVAFAFNPAKAFPGDFKVTLGINKAGSAKGDAANAASYDYEVPVNVTIVAPEAPAIVRNESYFNGNNAIVYGTATTNGVTEDFDNLFSTTGLQFVISKVSYDLNQDGSISSSEKVRPWVIDNATNVVTIPLRTDASKWNSSNTVKTSYYDTFNVGSTQTVYAWKYVFGNPYIDESNYTFTVTAKSPVAVSFTGDTKVMTEGDIMLAVDEFTGKSLKTARPLYIGKTDYSDATTDLVIDYSYIKDVKVAVDTEGISSQYITLGAATWFNDKVVRTVSENVTATVDAVKVLRKDGTALQSDVTCNVIVTVIDQWGVTTNINVPVTVKPIQ